MRGSSASAIGAICAPQRAPERRHYGSGEELIARLAPGATLAQARAQIAAHNAALERGSQVIDGRFTTRGSRARRQAYSHAPAGEHGVPAAHRRAQPGEPAPHPRQYAYEGSRDPTVIGGDPVGNRAPCARGNARSLLPAVSWVCSWPDGAFTSHVCWGLIISRWVRRSASTADSPQWV